MTLAEIRAEVQRRLQERSTSPIFWAAADIDLAINEGYGEISDATEWLEKVGTVTLNGTTNYDPRTVLEQCYLRIGHAYNPSTNRWLLPTSARRLDESDRRWPSRTGEPGFVLLRSIFHLRYFPIASSGSVKQYYTAIPSSLCADSASPGFTEQFHYSLVEYALYDLWAQDGETDLATQAWKEYLSYEAGLAKFVRDRLATPTVHGHQPELGYG
jgi:hypothetical protein